MQRVFGYASLTAVGEPVYVPGYRRTWTVAMDNSVDLPGYKYYVDRRSGQRPHVCVAFLDLVPDAGSEILGTVTEVGPAEFEALDRRERNYERVAVEPAGNAQAWAYSGLDSARRRARGALDQGKLVIAKHYLDAVLANYSAIGRHALDNFESTTEPPPSPIVDLERVDLPLRSEP